MKIVNETALSFDDVILDVQYNGDIESRSKDVFLGTKLKKIDHIFTLPIISSPMDTVTEDEMAFRMFIHGGLGILHRYNTIERQVELATSACKKYAEYCGYDYKKFDLEPIIIGAAIGATGDYLERADALVKAGVRVICVDIAHGHSIHTKRAIYNLRTSILPQNVHLMVGNISTAQAFKDIWDWGADSVRVGISSGAACSTAIQTGHGLPTLQSIIDCANEKLYDHSESWHPQIIADGGMKRPGDLVKAFAAGADFCMLGSMLAGTKCAPGEIINQNGLFMKSYRGSASKEAQLARGQTAPKVEGVSTLVPYKGKIENELDKIRNGLQSGCSYSGVKTLPQLHEKAVFRKISVAGYNQGIPHILSK